MAMFNSYAKLPEGVGYFISKLRVILDAQT